jgi:hypothetical protein
VVGSRPGGAAPKNSPASAAEQAWWKYRHYHPASAEDPHLAFVFAYRRAVTDMLADQFAFAGWDVLTRRLLEVLEELVVEREAELSLNMVDPATGEVIEAPA